MQREGSKTIGLDTPLLFVVAISHVRSHCITLKVLLKGAETAAFDTLKSEIIQVNGDA